MYIWTLVDGFFWGCCWPDLDLQFCCPANPANGIGIKIRSECDWERLSPRSYTAGYKWYLQHWFICWWMKNWVYSAVRNSKNISRCLISDLKTTQGLGKSLIYRWQMFSGFFSTCVRFNVNTWWHLTFFLSSHCLMVWFLRLLTVALC